MGPVSGPPLPGAISLRPVPACRENGARARNDLKSTAGRRAVAICGGHAVPENSTTQEDVRSRKGWDLALRPSSLEQRCDPVISCLLAARARFLIVGSWAVRFHGSTDRKVNDLDLLVEFSADNWPRLILALQHFGITVKRSFEELSQGPKPFQDKQLDPVHFLTAIGAAFSESESSGGSSPNSSRRLAVASLHHGVSFGEAWSDSVETSFGENGLRVRVPSKAHVILSKEDSSRASDADDVKRLLEAGW